MQNQVKTFFFFVFDRRSVKGLYSFVMIDVKHFSLGVNTESILKRSVCRDWCGWAISALALDCIALAQHSLTLHLFINSRSSIMCEFASLEPQIIRNESKPIMDMAVDTSDASQLSILFSLCLHFVCWVCVRIETSKGSRQILHSLRRMMLCCAV